MYVIKKDHTHEAWNVQKVVVAVNKSAYRAMVKFTQEELDFICSFVEDKARSHRRNAQYRRSRPRAGEAGGCEKLSGLPQL